METRPLVSQRPIRLGMLGLSPGNGHPYSWSAIFNGYDRERMEAECPYSGIPDYLGKEPESSFGIGDARVTHVCCTGEGEFSAASVAACSLIPHVVKDPEEMIGEVDAVILATDNGADHAIRAKPFVEAGVPIFIDKPLADNAHDLATFSTWVSDGASIMSSSALRYSKEYSPYRASTNDLGAVRFVSITHIKRWETYGIHALEAVYPILGPGFLTCTNTGTPERTVCHFTHRSGADVVVVISKDMLGGYGLLTIAGTERSVQVRSGDTFYAFKAQLAAFVSYLETGTRPFPFSETEELIRMVIAGISSRERGGATVEIFDVTRSNT